MKRRVLIAGDNVDIARSLWTILQRMGHEAEVAFAGPGALEKARCTRRDMVLLDLAMPGMAGGSDLHLVKPLAPQALETRLNRPSLP